MADDIAVIRVTGAQIAQISKMVGVLEARGARDVEVTLYRRLVDGPGPPVLYAGAVDCTRGQVEPGDRIEAYISEDGEEFGSRHEFVR